MSSVYLIVHQFMKLSELGTLSTWQSDSFQPVLRIVTSAGCIEPDFFVPYCTILQ